MRFNRLFDGHPIQFAGGSLIHPDNRPGLIRCVVTLAFYRLLHSWLAEVTGRVALSSERPWRSNRSTIPGRERLTSKPLTSRFRASKSRRLKIRDDDQKNVERSFPLSRDTLQHFATVFRMVLSAVHIIFASDAVRCLPEKLPPPSIGANEYRVLRCFNTLILRHTWRSGPVPDRSDGKGIVVSLASHLIHSSTD